MEKERRRCNGVVRGPSRTKTQGGWPPAWLQEAEEPAEAPPPEGSDGFEEQAAAATPGREFDPAAETALEPLEWPQEPAKPTRPAPQPPAAWEPELCELIAWLEAAKLPTEPFQLAPHLRIVDPQRFYAALKMDIAVGPGGTRARTGALAADLHLLQALFREAGV